MQTQIRWCSGCQDDQVFERAECDDSPGPGACDELCCGQCGLGVFDSVLMEIVESIEQPLQTTAGAPSAVA